MIESRSDVFYACARIYRAYSEYVSIEQTSTADKGKPIFNASLNNGKVDSVQGLGREPHGVEDSHDAPHAPRRDRQFVPPLDNAGHGVVVAGRLEGTPATRDRCRESSVSPDFEVKPTARQPCL